VGWSPSPKYGIKCFSNIKIWSFVARGQDGRSVLTFVVVVLFPHTYFIVADPHILSQVIAWDLCGLIQCFATCSALAYNLLGNQKMAVSLGIGRIPF
jgi:hypothetical protein